MTPASGSCAHAGAAAAAALLELGATNLEAKVGAYVASFGECCWQTDATLQRTLKRPDGKAYHVESIGRARRAMARAGWMPSLRVHVGQFPHHPLRPNERAPGVKRPSTHGTTSKTISWALLGVRNPLTRGERRKLAIAAGEPVPPLGPDPRDRPRHTAAPPLPPATRELAGELARALAPRWSEPAGERVSPAELDAMLAALSRGPPE